MQCSLKQLCCLAPTLFHDPDSERCISVFFAADLKAWFSLFCLHYSTWLSLCNQSLNPVVDPGRVQRGRCLAQEKNPSLAGRSVWQSSFLCTAINRWMQSSTRSRGPPTLLSTSNVKRCYSHAGPSLPDSIQLTIDTNSLLKLIYSISHFTFVSAPGQFVSRTM